LLHDGRWKTARQTARKLAVHSDNFRVYQRMLQAGSNDVPPRGPVTEGNYGKMPARNSLTLVYWLRSLISYILLGLYIAIVGPPALAVAFVTGRSGHVVILGRFGARATRTLLGIRLAVEGLEHVDGDRPSVYCMNHRSNVDVVAFEALFPRCPRLRGLYKTEVGRVPVLGRAMRLVGFVPVDRANRASAIASVDEAAERLAAGDSFLMAPEGTRGRSDELQPFKKGGFVMAIKAQAPVVPVALHGTAEAMPRGRFWVRPAVVRVEVGAPIPTIGLTLDDRDRLMNTLRDRLQAMLRG
jgi:1-acyl-sn-glycerol-3-phosphate acyltransferase